MFSGKSQLSEIMMILDRPERTVIRLRGLSGSMPAFVSAAYTRINPSRTVLVFPEREEAAYFFNDLENLLGRNNVLFFPSSLKKPYIYPVADNTNILSRAEVLTHLSKSNNPVPVVTYAEAFQEKVLTRKSLEKNTIEARVGDDLSVEFLTEFLNDNGFDLVDFVYEAGQFSVRGGIVDIFSFANEQPYRLEFVGDIIRSIRVFDPVSQLSEKSMNHISVIPNVQQKMVEEHRQSFTDFLSDDVVIWFKNFSVSRQVMEKGYEKMLAAGSVDQDQFAETDLVKGKPGEIFDSEDILDDPISRFRIIEFGTQFSDRKSNVIEFRTKPQQAFNKNFVMLGEQMLDNSSKGYKTVILSDTAKQVERIYSIFEDIELPSRKAGQQVEFSPLLLSVHEGFIDDELKLVCYTDHQIFNRYHRYRIRRNYGKSEAITLKELYALKPGDFVTHIDHGIGKFGGLEKLEVRGKVQEAIRLVYKDNDILYVSIHSLHRVSKYSGKEGKQPVLNKLGSNNWNILKQRTKKKVKDIAKELIALYAKRKAQKGFAFSRDNYLQTELEASFIYEDTPDQNKCTAELKKDMERPYPMDRLICGDVGFGKTELAIRAAFKAAADGKQVAVLVPTTILALQHYRTFSARLKDFPVTVDYLNRFKSTAQQTETKKKLLSGEIDIVIGTHRILSKDIRFRDLGLLIIDEEQKFGVSSKEKLKEMRTNVDTLTLTATPIPRTLQFSLMGARDLSVINTPPPNRYPVTTELHVFSEKIIQEAIMFEVSRGGQVFFVHNRVQDIHEISELIRKLCPDVSIGIGHGQMDGAKLEKVLLSFIEGETDVLVSTTIIESGLDISNANTIIINQAHHFGLSDLHQMRGRVGRSNTRAFCYLLSPPLTGLTQEARQRLKAVEEFSDLGSGFAIAMRDLDIRGAGNMLGAEQSGFISEIGYEMYHKILDEAITELKETEFRGLFPEEEHQDFVSDCQIDTDLEILIPTSYITNISERLSIYKELDELADEQSLHDYLAGLQDRFGPLPHELEELTNAIRLRWNAKQLGFEKLTLKAGSMKCTFVSNPSSGYYKSGTFAAIIGYVQSNPGKIRLEEKKNRLTISFSGVHTVEQANEWLSTLIDKCLGKTELAD